MRTYKFAFNVRLLAYFFQIRCLEIQQAPSYIILFRYVQVPIALFSKERYRILIIRFVRCAMLFSSDRYKSIVPLLRIVVKNARG